MGSKVVYWEKNEGVGCITLNRPEKYNALSRELMLDLPKTLQEAAADVEVKTIVITGAGKAFCSGGDLTRHPLSKTDNLLMRENYLREVGNIVSVLHKVPKPVIAAVNGVAAGGGLSLALACDIRISSDQAKFSAIFVRAGLMPDMAATWFLPRLVGLGKAFELLFTGDVIGADEALRIGLVNQVVPHENLMNRATDLAKRFAKGPIQSYRLTKWAVYRAFTLDVEAALEHETFGQNFLIGTEDAKIAAKAFAEKTTPVFKGK